MLGMESQEHIHYAMPMRIMGYDYGAYKKQYDNNAVKYKNGKGYLRVNFCLKEKNRQIYTSVTAVIYYGERPWDGAVSLHGMLDIPKQFSRYVNDYKMILIEAGNNNLKLHNVNNRDLINLVGMLVDKRETPGKRKEAAIHYVKKNHDR